MRMNPFSTLSSIDGWQTLSQDLADNPIDLAA